LAVRPLPRRVHRWDADLAGIADRVDRVVLGVGGDDARPVTVDLSTGRAFVVLGGPGSGVSTAVDTVAHGAARSGMPVLVVRPAGPAVPPTAPAASGRLWLTDSVDPLHRFLAGHDGPLALLVDGFAPQLGPLGGPLDELVVTYLRVAGPGQTLVLGARIDAAVRAGSRGALATALGARRTVLLQPEPADARVLGARVARAAPPVRPGRGFLVDAGVTIAVQIALADGD